MYGSKWAKIAEALDCGRDAEQCKKRWHYFADPALLACRNEDWTEDEVDACVSNS